MSDLHNSLFSLKKCWQKFKTNWKEIYFKDYQIIFQMHRFSKEISAWLIKIFKLKFRMLFTSVIVFAFLSQKFLVFLILINKIIWNPICKGFWYEFLLWACWLGDHTQRALTIHSESYELNHANRQELYLTTKPLDSETQINVNLSILYLLNFTILD